MATKAKKKVTTASKKKPTPKLSGKRRPALSLVDNQTEFKLEAFTEVPPIIRRGGGQKAVYPFAAMPVGQKFFVNATIDESKYSDAGEAKKAQDEALQTAANRLSGAVRRFTKKNEGYAFNVRKHQAEDGSWGIWVGRTA
jgi:hypothetical protein